MGRVRKRGDGVLMVSDFIGPDRWPTRWKKKAEALRDVDWLKFRRHPDLMEGIQLHSSELREWLKRCQHIPERLRVDSTCGDPIGEDHGYGLVTADSLKFAHYADRVRAPERCRLLEIGAGYGGLVRALYRRGTIRNVALIDAEPCLRMQEYFIGVTCPDLPIVKHDSEREYDLVVNAMSLGEMHKDEVARYFDVIHRQLKPGGVFFTLNRVHRVTDFADYPFDANWIREERVTEYSPAYVACLSVRTEGAV